MSSSKLKITRNGSVITIKKKPEAWVCVIFSLILLCLLFFPFLMRKAWDQPFFWGLWALLCVNNGLLFLNLMLGSVILDTAEQKLTVKLLGSSTCDFCSVDSVAPHFTEGDSDGGLDRNKVCIRLIHNKRVLVVHTTGREQSRELAEIVESTIRQTMFPSQTETDP